ncbi:uncharacterized protein [Clytia hemisphaerica]|uniref:Uncharacterized protein n=1 Tax=Clytia hemisphaerica TaxID=252671 RepID=A0A7M5UH56_9CNID
MDLKKIYTVVLILVLTVVVTLYMQYKEGFFKIIMDSSPMRSPMLRPLDILQNTSWSAKFKETIASFRMTENLATGDSNATAVPLKVIKKLKLSQKDIIKRYEDRLKLRKDSWEHHDAVCKIPNLNPFGPSGMKAWATKTKQYCDIKKLGKIVKNRFIVEDPGSKISLVTMEYILRGRKRKADGSLDPPKGRTSMVMDSKYSYHKVLNDDFHAHFTIAYKVIFNKERGVFMSSPLEHDFFRAVITMKTGSKTTEYHATIHNKDDVCRKHGRKFDPKSKTGLPLNVHMFMVDAISKGNAYRQMPRLMEILEDDEDAMVFQAHGIHGDGTTCQLMATLAGYKYRQEDSNPWQPPNKQNCDGIDLIFKDFHKAGYTTLYNEDFVSGSTFHYKMNGFDKPPSDWYPRPYWIAAHERVEGCGRPPCICEDEEMIRFLKTFTTFCEHEAKFSIQVTANAHDDMNLLFMLEDQLIELYEFYKEKARVENTMLIFFGDHGARWGARGNFRNTKQGRLEEYNPFYSLILPPNFKKNYRELYDNIKANQNVLTSHFDVHWTLKHILSYPKIEEKRNYGQSLFTKIDPKTRTCDKTGIPGKYCFCLSTKKIDANTSQANTIAQTAVDFINKKIAEHEKPKELCANLTLSRIIDLEYAADEQKNEGIFYIMFEVAPSKATFDVRVRKDLSKQTTYVDPEISRTNLYRNQPACIQVAYPKLAPFCYCKVQTS